MAPHDTIQPLLIQKTKGTHTVHHSQPSVASLIEYTRGLLDAEDQQHAQATDAASGPVSHSLSPGATVDLSKKSIHELPVEVIELIKDRVERLALSHNPQVLIPSQIVKCERLRYLNVRVNHLTEFPEAILSLTQLEILDLSKNELTSIPEDIKKMKSLRFLAVVRNRISRLPLAFGQMPNLHKLKFEDNPIVFPSAEELQMHESPDKNGNTGLNKDTEVCMQVKRVMNSVIKSKALRQRLLKSSSEEDASESNTETPRPPRRLANGRFPVRPSISGVEGLGLGDIIRSASNSPPEPTPLLTQRTIGDSPSRDGSNGTVRLAPTSHAEDDSRSRSESVSTSASFKSRRQGLLPAKRNNDPGHLQNAGLASVRSSNASTIRAAHHAYKASTSSTLSGISSGAESAAPSPNNRLGTRITRNNMSSRPQLPVSVSAGLRLHRSLSNLWQPLLQVAQGVVNDMPGRSRIEAQLSTANALVREMEDYLDMLNRPDIHQQAQSEIARKLTAVLRSVLSTYSGLIETTRAYTSQAGSTAEPFLARSLMFQLYSITVEARNIASLLRVPIKNSVKDSRDTPRASTASQAWSSRTATPTDMKSNITTKRLRGATIIRNQPSTAPLRVIPPSQDRTDTSFLNSASPISAKLINGVQRRGPSRLINSSSDEHDETVEQFERIFLKLKEACAIAGEALPNCEAEIKNQHNTAIRDGQQHRARSWQKPVKTCRKVREMRKALEDDLERVQVGDPNIRNAKEFWQLCDNFVQSWTEFATDIKDIGTARVDISVIRNIMKPVQRAVKDVSKTISDSPLYHQALRGTNHTTRSLQPPFPALDTALARAVAQTTSNPPSATPTSAQNMNTISMPATPLTAALGPAAQATIASTPNAMLMGDYFQGINVNGPLSSRPAFERLDTAVQTSGSSSAPSSAVAAPPAHMLGQPQLPTYSRRL